MAQCIIVVGLQWGDEGKGKVTDALAKEADMVVRFQGGANAGHTVVISGKRIILHQVPSGILNPTAHCLIGPAVVVDPETLLAEISSLREAGIEVDPSRLTISAGAPVVLPVHKTLDILREQASGSGRIGTTGRGIGPAYEDMTARRAVRMVDLCHPDRLSARVKALLAERNLLIAALGGTPFDPDSLVERLLGYADLLKPYLGDTGRLISEAFTSGKRVLFEGAQGTLLDVVHGTYPFVTSSLTTAPAAFALSGVGIPASVEVLGVMKAYTTRVGEGPFPTEDKGDFGEHLRLRGAEFGATTGRPRRCGALDLPALRYAVRLNGVTGLALTKLDVLSGLKHIPVCTAYMVGEEVLEVAGPLWLGATYAPKPIYAYLEGWPQWNDLSRSDLAAIPERAREYLRFVEDGLGVPVKFVSLGPDREDSVFATSLWK